MQEATVHLDDLPKLKRMYNLAVKNGSDSFKCVLVCGKEGEFHTPFAKYLIEHLENVSKCVRN